mmetsp:Transcript_37135/g.55331  ORF Transcript_37135/g.55331 Transcript_37135/m.55331 type:complete len:211 (+) Transcript_37135:24-656(+)
MERRIDQSLHPPSNVSPFYTSKHTTIISMVLKPIIKQIVLVALIVYGFPVVWWTYNDMDGEPPDEYFLSVRFLMSTGFLLIFSAVSYLYLPIDLAFDWIPILGKLDDMLAKMTFGAGLMMCYMGYQFGSGKVPKEFEIVVTVVTWIYGILVPLFKMVLPLLGPLLKALAIPMKAAAKAILNLILDRTVAEEAAAAAATAAAESYGATGDL